MHRSRSSLRVHRRWATGSLAWGLGLVLWLGMGAGAQAVTAPAKPGNAASQHDPRLFPTDMFIRKQVRFWELVFQRYPSSTVLLHDVDEPDRVIDLIDFVLFAERDRQKDSLSLNDRQKITAKYLERYSLAVERFAKLGRSALKFGAIEKRVWNVYENNPEATKRLLSGRVRFRSQGGLSDTFIAAANIAQDYLPYMESVFKAYRLPPQLTRIAFVESMFNIGAKSKVGASGIWQFMPQTARLYMHVGGSVDERNSPYKATRAAAQLLLDNYNDLRSWPLAITAYNHGRGGMERAARSVGSRDLGTIIRGYESRAFGFASQNFYSEFIAAANTFEWLTATGKVKRRPPLKFDEPIILSKRINPNELKRVTGLSEETLLKHNPCLLPTAFREYSHKPLPPSYELRVPIDRLASVKLALRRLKGPEYISRR